MRENVFLNVFFCLFGDSRLCFLLTCVWVLRFHDANMLVYMRVLSTFDLTLKLVANIRVVFKHV